MPLGLEETCEGTGFLICNCGGDLCVCGMDGEPCPGCEDCRNWSPFDTHRPKVR